MATTRRTATRKRKDAARNSSGSGTFEILNVGLTTSSIRCSGCNRIPDKFIYNCVNSHLLCDICCQCNDTCSEASCTGKLLRSTEAEKVLDTITFKCPFKCDDDSIRRDQLTSHMKNCERSPNFLNCSQLFHNDCDFKFRTLSVDDEVWIKEMKEHLQSHEDGLSVSDTIFGSNSKEDNFLIRELEDKNYVTEVLDWECGEQTMGTFMIVWVVEANANKMSRYFVCLAENHKVDAKVEVQVKIKGQPKPTCRTTGNFLPDLEWRTVGLNIGEFREVLELPIQERKFRNYSMEVCHMQDYYINDEGEVNVEYSLSSLIPERQEKRTKTSSKS